MTLVKPAKAAISAKPGTLQLVPKVLTPKLARKSLKQWFDEEPLKSHWKIKTEIFDKWDKCNIPGLFKNLSHDQAVELACVGENQRLMRENCKSENERKVSVPIALRIHANDTLHNIVAVQTLLGSTGLTYLMDRHGEMQFREIIATTKRMKCVWSFEAAQDLRAVFNIDPLQELAAVFAQEMTIEDTREVLSDLRNNCEKFECHVSNRTFIDYLDVITAA